MTEQLNHYVIEMLDHLGNYTSGLVEHDESITQEERILLMEATSAMALAGAKLRLVWRGSRGGVH